MDNVIDLNEERIRMVAENFFEDKHCDSKKFKLLNRWYESKCKNFFEENEEEK